MRRTNKNPGRRSRGPRESDRLADETYEMEAQLRQLQAKVDQERANMSASIRSSKSQSGTRWSRAQHGSISSYGRDIISKHESVATQRAYRDSTLRKTSQVQVARAKDNTNNRRPTSAASQIHQQIMQRPATQWTIEDVHRWLESIGLGRYASSFSENEINGEVLLEMGSDDLDYLNIKILGHRKVLLRGIRQLQQRVAEASIQSSSSTVTDKQSSMSLNRASLDAKQSFNHTKNNKHSSEELNQNKSMLNHIDTQRQSSNVSLNPANVSLTNHVHWTTVAAREQAKQQEKQTKQQQEKQTTKEPSLLDLANQEHNEAAEREAFQAAVMQWRNAQSNETSGTSPHRPHDVSNQDSNTMDTSILGGWSNPADTSMDRSNTTTSTIQSNGQFDNSLSTTNKPVSKTNSLLSGKYDEEAEHKAFQEAVLAWRQSNRSDATLNATSVSTQQTATGTSTTKQKNDRILNESTARALGIDQDEFQRRDEKSWYKTYQLAMQHSIDGAESHKSSLDNHVATLRTKTPQQFSNTLDELKQKSDAELEAIRARKRQAQEYSETIDTVNETTTATTDIDGYINDLETLMEHPEWNKIDSMITKQTESRSPHVQTSSGHSQQERPTSAESLDLNQSIWNMEIDY